MSSMIRKPAYWVRSGEFELATHAHLPATTIGATAVLICGTVGFEAIHAYRCMVRLGDAFAEHGTAAFRFDFAGTGNSSGDASDADLVAEWQRNIVDQVRDLTGRWGFARVTLVGFRLGAALMRAALETPGVGAVAFWEPVTRGKSFVRETRAVAQFAEDPTGASEASIESGGFVFSSHTLAAISSLSVDAGAVPGGIPVLLLSRGKNARLGPEAFADRNPFEEFRTAEYDRMICEPHYTEIPVDSIACMTRWHTGLTGESPSLPDLRDTAKVAGDSGQDPVEEQLFRTADGNLFGIVSRPRAAASAENRTLVLSNAGSVCSIGPNRVYVETARALARVGWTVVRFDLRNLGDSVSGDVANANAPYPDTASTDIARVLAHLRDSQGASTFILAGLCSGSHASYHFALANEDPDVREIVLINPLTFYYTPGMSLDNPVQHRTVRYAKSYSRSARDARNWRRLLTGQVNYRRLATFVVRIVARTIGNVARKVAAIWTRHPVSRMDEDLASLGRRGVKVTYVFSDTDPGYWIARVESPNIFRRQIRNGESDIIFIENADHTLSRNDKRKEMIAKLIDHLQAAD